MKLYARFKKLIACAILIAFIPSQAWAQGITIPSGSSLNINTGQLIVPGNITNAGTLAATTGPITLTGNWANSGTFTAGTGTVNFSGTSGTQTLNSGGTAAADAFYNLIHNAASTVQLTGNAVLINQNFTNTAGTFNANSLNMTVDNNWDNTAAFTPGTNTVTLNGGNQSVIGSTSFYDFSKIVGTAATLTFDHTGLQNFSNNLTMQGVSGQLLSIRSDLPNTQADIALSASGLQSINFVDVKDSNAGTPPTQQTLIGRNASAGSPTQNNTNWSFGGATITWTGAVSTDWNNPSNWSPLSVPTAADSVIIPSAPSNQPIFSTDVQVANLTIQPGASVDINGHNITVSSAFVNKGTLELFGNETTVSLAQDITDPGTFEYLGDGTGNPITIKPFTVAGSADYYNLVINDTNATKNIFVTNSNIKTVGTATVTSGTLDISANTDTLTVGGILSVNGANGTLTATNGNITANGAVDITAGTFTAPGAGKTFTVSGDFTNNAGNYVPVTHVTGFNDSGGTVTLNGGSQSVLGTTVFFNFVKTVTSPQALTFDATVGALQTFTNNLTLGGTAGNLLTINSTVSGTQGFIALTAPGTQAINFVNVQDSNASGGVLLFGRNASPGSPTQNNTNWSFGAATLTWTGGTSTNWNDPTNWDKGIVPAPGDTVIIPNGGPITFQPVLTTPVSVGNLTIDSGSTLTLNGNNLTVSSTFSNNGNVVLEGNEALTLTMDSTHGTFTYVGDGNATQDTRTLTINGSPNVAFNNLVIDDPNATPADRDIFATNGTLTVNGGLTVTSGTLNASNASSSIVDNGAFTLGGSGVFDAPPAGKAFDVGGNFSNSGGTFNNDSGTITFITAATSIISGNTTFYNFASTAAGKTIEFTAGSDQTVTNAFNLAGMGGSLISLLSTIPGTSWNVTLSGGAQTVGELDVQDSNALTNTVTCFNCTNGGHNNPNWIFSTLYLSSPAIGTTIGQTPTIIGVGPVSSTVYLRDAAGHLVATAKTDTNGNFRVVVGQDAAATGLTITPQLAVGANSLTPYPNAALTAPGLTNSVTVVASATTNQVPVITKLNGVTITNPNIAQFISGGMPTIAGQGLAGQNVTAQALDASGNLIETAVLGVVAGDGTYSVTFPTALTTGTNFLSITVGTTVNETTSALIQVILTDPFGVVYNSTTNLPIKGALVTLYSNTTHLPATGVQSCNLLGVCTSSSSFTTLADGFYSYLAPPGQYYMTVTAPGYTYPSVQTVVPAGRFVNTGSKGEVFTVGVVVFQLDQPMDANNMLLRITKTANKTEGSVGDIVMYTVNLQNLSASNDVTGVYLNDEIPPGFKYIKDRVLLNSAPIADPAGQRPLLFNVGTVSAGSTDVLQYQLVIGSGVTMGNYQNTAMARYANGTVISNPAQASVKIVLDPVFDLGTVIGKVFFDWNENGIQDPPFFDPVSHQTIVEKPVPNVQLVMEDGTTITTDHDGKFSIPGLLPGRHLFRLDERSLPPGAYMTTDKTVIVDITAGSISKVNFGVNIDESQTKSRDAVFFNEKIALTQDRNRPVPRLNDALFNASVNAKPNTEEVLLHEGALVRQAEFRIFTNYSSFIGSWHLDILDADTKKVIKSFEGTSLNISDPIYWNGLDTKGMIIDTNHKYSYIVTVTDSKNNHDDTKEKPITVREITDDISLKKERDDSKDALKDRANRYRTWLTAQEAVNNLDHQLIQVQGETIHLNRQGTDVRSIRVMKGKNLFMDIPLVEQYGLTPDELMAGGFSTTDEKDNLEIILPNGDYSLDVVSAKAPEGSSPNAPAELGQTVPPASGMPSRTLSAPAAPGTLEHYSRPLKVGDDYLMFVALGDEQVGYNIDRGNIEPIQDKTEEPGFYSQGKGAYYLKGQILGKYLITSSFDSDRAQKALFRQLDPNTYYPVYGDSSSINYDAADTQGALYLLVQWDKSSAILGNYAIDFNDTEFAAFSQKYYGGKIDYQSVANNPYGDARTKLVIYHAQVQQLPSHNEFLATGGSLYFLKFKNVIQGSDTVTIQVRDQTTGLVVASQTMTNGADYELDNSEGRILFWQPVAMIAQSENIISNNLINGNPIYVVVDYSYAAAGLQTEGTQGARVAQAIGDNLVLGGTYIEDNSSGQNYTLAGTDATLHVTKDATIKAEYAKTTSQETGSYVSTDGGISFTPLMLNSNASGEAYGIKGDARLFDNIGLKTYYKWIGNDFGATDTTYQQGKQTMGMSMTFDMTPVTRLTASEDIQRLLAGGNLQTATQVGASETDTTMVQIVHTAERLTMTGQFQLIQTKSVINGVESTTNTSGATLAGQAKYDLTDRIKLTLGQQVDVTNPANTATTIGAAARITDQTTLNAQEVFSNQGRALTAGLTNQIGKKVAVTTNYTLTNLNTGEVDKTAGVLVTDQFNKNISLSANVASTASSLGTTTNTASVGVIDKISDAATMNLNVGKSQNTLGAQGGTNLTLNGTTQIGDTTVTGTAQTTAGASLANANPLGAPINTSATATPSLTPTAAITATSSVGLQAVTKINENTSTNGSVNVATESTGEKETTFAFGNTSKLDQELQAVTSNSFSFSPDNGNIESSKYGLTRTQNGQNLEADFTKESANQPGTITQSNIFGLTGDVNDKLALNGSIERGKVQNLNVSQTDRTDFTFGAGYVLKDTVTAEARLKNSIKLELRMDKGIGTDSLRQYVLYDALDGKITDNLSANAKVDYSITRDTTNGATAERHQEIILGMAYRPVNFDNLNLITEYSYQDGYGGGLQQADALNTNVLQTKAQVLSAEAVYDISDNWQLAEKIAYRIESEQDTGFQFTQTHTWLVIHRLNYKIDRNWTVSAEYRDLAQVEAKDNKQGILLEATHELNNNTELGIGWNFTSYSDDLTNLSYTSQGPFVRMTGKFYDRTPEEKARDRAKWMDARINDWAWMLIRKEFAKKDSKIVLELNRMFALAKASQKAGRLEESRQIYKDIITAGQMMYDEASEYIRGRIAFEEDLQKLDVTAREYFRGGEYVKARKIWEKVVDDASKGVIK